MYGEGPVADGSDEESEEDFKAEEDDQENVPVSTSMPTPESLVSPALGSNQHMQSDVEPNALIHRARTLPMRQNQQPQMDDHAYNDPNFYSRGMGIGFQPQSPNVHDPARRSFGVPSPSYTGPQQSIYGWQGGNMVSNGPIASNYYPTSTQGNLPQTSGPYQLPPVNMLPPPPPPQHQFDGLNGRSYDSGAALGNQLRTGSLAHPPHIVPHGYQDFMNVNGSFGHHDSGLKDEQHLHTN